MSGEQRECEFEMRAGQRFSVSYAGDVVKVARYDGLNPNGLTAFFTFSDGQGDFSYGRYEIGGAESVFVGETKVRCFIYNKNLRARLVLPNNDWFVKRLNIHAGKEYFEFRENL